VITFFSLFFMKNIFNIEVGHKIIEGAPETPVMTGVTGSEMSEIMKYILLGILIAGTVIGLYYYLLERKKTRELKISEEKFWKNLK